MGKKAKVTGSPDVVKFKQTREFQLMLECATLFEGLPVLSTEGLSQADWKKVSLFLTILGLLAEHTQSQSSRDFRFQFYHQYLAPPPQLYPSGFDVDVLRKVRQAQEQGKVEYNSKFYYLPTEIEAKAEKFLKDVDAGFNKIFCATIEPRLKDDWEGGVNLREFKKLLKDELEVFDKMWAKFEIDFLKAQHEILKKVFESVEVLVTTESALCKAEQSLDVEAKQQLENEFAHLSEKMVLEIFPDRMKGDARRFPENVIPLAEACLFYDSKCSEELLDLAKVVIKDYFELRFCVARIPEERLCPQLRENGQLCRLLWTFHASVLAAEKAFSFVAQLPNISYTKTTDWMTKDLMEKDVRHFRSISYAQLARERELAPLPKI